MTSWTCICSNRGQTDPLKSEKSTPVFPENFRSGFAVHGGFEYGRARKGTSCPAMFRCCVAVVFFLRPYYIVAAAEKLCQNSLQHVRDLYPHIGSSYHSVLLNLTSFVLELETPQRIRFHGRDIGILQPLLDT
jgi:hypothetical protein